MTARIFSNDFNRLIAAVKAFVGGRGPHEFVRLEFDAARSIVKAVACNGNYLLSALQAAKVSAGGTYKNPIILEFTGPTSPCVIRTNKDDIKMVMPIRLKAE